MWSVIENATSLVESIIITVFTTRVLGFKSPRHNYLKSAIYAFVLFANITYIADFIPDIISQSIPGIIQIIISIIFSLIFLKGAVFLKIYISFLSSYMIFLINVPILVIFNNFTDGPISVLINDESTKRIAIIVLSKSLYWLATWAFCKWYKKHIQQADFDLNNFEWLTMLIISGLSFSVGLYIFQANVMQSSPLAVFLSSFVTFVINALVLYALVRSAQNRHKAIEIKAYQIANEAIKTSLDNYIKHSTEIRAIEHDIKNTLLAAISLIENQEYDKFKNYFFSAMADLQKADTLDTGIKNAYINAIIQQKYAECKYPEISFACSASGDFKNHEEINSMDIIDICVIICNLLDNAIEAYDGKSKKYEININLDSVYNKYRIEVSNPISQSLLEKNPDLKTNKPDAKNHGLGIKSIKSRAEKYNGSTEFTEEDGKFVARVWLTADSKE